MASEHNSGKYKTTIDHRNVETSGDTPGKGQVGFTSTEKELQECKEKVHKLARDINTLTGEHKYAQNEVTALKRENDDLKDENRKLKTDYETLKSRCRSSREEGNNKLADEVKQLKDQNRQLQTNNDDLYKALKSAKSTSNHGMSSHSDNRFREELEKCRADNSSLRAEIDRLRTSLSKVAGDKMSSDNPFIADLSDPYRPQRLSEKCNSLYDNSWTDAFENMKGTDEKNEKHVCEFLLNIFKNCWEFCLEIADKQLHRISDLLSCDPKAPSNTKSLDKSSPSFKLCKDVRRLLTKDFIPNLCQVYWESRRDVASNRNIQPYVFACIELCWYSAISDPPLVFDFVGRRPEDFKVYTKSGSKIDYIVWPAMYLHEKGPLLYKGVLQCK